MATTYLTRTFASGGNRKKWTYSVWFKRSKIGHSEDSMLFQTYGSTYTYCPIQSDDTFRFQDGSGGNKITNRKLTDCNAWYHIVVAIDTDHVTADDRYKIYINGVRETSFSTSTNPSSGYEGEWNKATLMNIGRHSGGSSYYDGLMSHIHFCDGYQYAASDFGSTDATTGEWKMNTSPSVSYGTTGFTILKDGNTITDQSANSNNWTLGAGTLTNTEDCPSDVFCTLNSLYPNTATITNGNTQMQNTSGNSSVTGTICPNKGKYYWEVKLVSGQSGYPRIGIFKMDGSSNHAMTTYLCAGGDGSARAWGSGSGTNSIFNGANSASAFASYTNGSILQFAMDLDNGKVWFGKDNTWYTNSSSTCTIADIANNTATPAFADLGTGVNWTPAIFGNTNADVWAANFGNGYFGTTAISSEGTNASGIGKFEYDVPTGFTAISTKGLNS